MIIPDRQTRVGGHRVFICVVFLMVQVYHTTYCTGVQQGQVQPYNTESKPCGLEKQRGHSPSTPWQVSNVLRNKCEVLHLSIH